MLGLYFRLIGARIRCQMQYKVSFCLEMMGFFLTTGLEFAIIGIIFYRFRSIGGWSLPEVALLYGMTSIALSLAEMVGRGFDSPFERMMMSGSFDQVLTRPLDSFFQVLASDFQVRRLGRTIQGAAVLWFAFARLGTHWTPAAAAVLALGIISGTVVYLGLFVIGATICFWTIRTPEVINAFTFGGHELTCYPTGIYSPWLRFTFLFVVPVAFANYPASLLVLGRQDPFGLPGETAWLAPVVAAVFFAASLAFFRFGVSRYQSTGS